MIIRFLHRQIEIVETISIFWRKASPRVEVFETRIWQNQLNFKCMDCILSWIRFAGSLMTRSIHWTHKRKRLGDLLIESVCVCVWVNALLCSNVTFWIEWRVRSRFLEHFHVFFYVGSYRVGIGYTLCTLFTFLI